MTSASAAAYYGLGGLAGGFTAASTTLAAASPAAPATAAAAGGIPALPSDAGAGEDAAGESGWCGWALPAAEAESSPDGLARCRAGVLCATRRMPGSRLSVSI